MYLYKETNCYFPKLLRKVVALTRGGDGAEVRWKTRVRKSGEIISRHRKPGREELRRGGRERLLLLAAASGPGRVGVASGRRGGRRGPGRRGLRLGEVERRVEVLQGGCGRRHGGRDRRRRRFLLHLRGHLREMRRRPARPFPVAADHL